MATIIPFDEYNTEDAAGKGNNKKKKDKKLAGIGIGFPHSNVRIDTGVNIEDGKTYKRVLPDYGATRVKGPRKAV